MTERKPTDDGEGRKPPATDDGQTRRTFLGAAAALGTLPAVATTATAEGGDGDREVLDDARGRRYADGDYGETVVSSDAVTDVEIGANDGATVEVSRACGGVDLHVRTGGVGFLLSLSRDEVERLRKELEYAEEQIVPEAE